MKNPNIESRLLQLETQVNWYKKCTFIGVNIFIGFLLLSANPSNQDEITPKITAKSIDLVNEAGNTVMALRALTHTGSILIYNSEGEEMMSLSADKNEKGGLLEIQNKAASNRVQIRSNMKSGAIKIFNDADESMVFISEDPSTSKSGYINLTNKIILEATKSKIYVADEEKEGSFVEIP